mmetsp:Transcript_20124/g.31937  ORF Transcript_20124/g.31937 Transcript_20124/m.31937 type:complete len:240 (+) Transcript_20124:330-1049(+)
MKTKLTHDEITHSPFLKELQVILKEFEVLRAMDMMVTEPSSDPKVLSALNSKQAGTCLLSQSKEDQQIAINEGKSTKHERELCMATFNQALPKEHGFIAINKPPEAAVIWSTLTLELHRDGPEAITDIREKLFNLDVKNCDGKMTKVAAEISECQASLEQNGGKLGLQEKLCCLTSSLKPASDCSLVLMNFDAKNQKSFTGAASELKRLPRRRDSATSRKKPPQKEDKDQAKEVLAGLR